ncbi:hypothetical protein Tco_0138418 [Tanacetum coccineum]
MTTLKFADSHNMVAFLSKPAESEGFEQIVDFINAHPIMYAPIVNPTIYVSCIEQFWSSVVAKTINGEVQLHTLVDGKRIVITETSIRRNLRLAYAEGIDCFSNSTIFENLALMGPKTTAWNEFSSTIASAIICLGSAIPTDPQHTLTILHPSTSQPQKTQTPRELTRLDTKIPQSSGPTKHVADKAVYQERGDSLVRAATTASSLEAEHDSGSGPRCQETMGGTIAQTRFENVFTQSYDPLLARGNTLQSGEDSLKLKELIELCTNLQQRVLDLEKIKTTQAEEIVSLNRRIKKLEQKKRSITHKLKRLRKVVSTTGAPTTISVATTTTATTVDEITLAQAL